MHIRKVIILLLLVSAIGLAACTRSASREPTAVPGENGGQPGEATPGGEATPEGPGDVATAIQGGEFLTQTAQAGDGGDGEPQATPGPEETEPPDEATQPPDEATEPPDEATEPPPKPTKAPSTVDCSSPFTVKAGDWVWDIGRRCNVHPQDIIAANNLYCYYDFASRLQCPVYAGDKLILPANARPFPGP